MKTIFIIFAALLVSGCMKPVVYKPDSQLTQQERDEAGCKVTASEYRDSYFPNNPIVNAQGRAERFGDCMKAKGYSASR
jgi:hypothetical protein